MKITNSLRLIAFSLAGLMLTISIALPQQATGQEESEFRSKTIDIGVVVADQEKSLEFYTKAIGMTEVPGFQVGAKLATTAGLTKQSGLSIKVLTLGESKTASKLKLVQVVGAESAKQSNDFIETQAGLSYITIHVTDMNAAVARLEKEGVKILAQGPAELPKELAEGVFLTLVRDPDGNFVELVGPKAEN